MGSSINRLVFSVLFFSLITIELSLSCETELITYLLRTVLRYDLRLNKKVQLIT